MTFAFICDPFFQKKVSPVLVNGNVPNHKIITIAANDFLESGKLPEDISGLIFERETWQKNFSMFRYFGYLPILEKFNIAFVANNPDADFKGRVGMKGKEFIIPNSINSEDATAHLNSYAELDPPDFVHSKSRAIA